MASYCTLPPDIAARAYLTVPFDQSDDARMLGCRRRSKSEPPCRPNIEPGVEAGLELTGCG